MVEHLFINEIIICSFALDNGIYSYFTNIKLSVTPNHKEIIC